MTGQTGTKRALLGATLAAAAVGLTGCGSGPSDASTTLHGASGVAITSPGHDTTPAVDGQQLQAGETVTTTATATELNTGGRLTTIAPDSSLTLTGRSRYDLNDGTAVVDRRSGPAVTLLAGDVTVDQLGKTAVRVDRGFAVRVAVYDGGSAVVGAGSRQLTVAALHQVQVPGASLPTQSAPLALSDDAMDTVADPGLVADDEALNARAAGLDGPGASVVDSVLVSEVPTLLPAATATAADTGLPLSERILSIAIARSAPAPAATVFPTVEAMRTDGGAWAVVAALADAPLTTVDAQISLLADGPSRSTTATNTAGTVLADGGPPVLPGTVSATPTVSTSGAPTPTVTTTPTPSTTRSTRPTVSTSPTPTPTPSQGVVADLLNTVVGLLGVTPTTASTGTTTHASVTPTPSPSGLLGLGVL